MNKVFLIFLTSFYSTMALAVPQPSVCELIKQSKEPSAYLLEKNGELSKGPINYGKYAYIYQPRDTYSIPTDYKIIITPGRINVRSCSENCLELKKIKPVCPMSQTYSVSYIRRDSHKNAHEKNWLPLKERTDFDISYDDPASIYPVELKFHFETAIEGEIFDATPKGSQ
jgi:hypothetical protein